MTHLSTFNGILPTGASLAGSFASPDAAAAPAPSLLQNAAALSPQAAFGAKTLFGSQIRFGHQLTKNDYIVSQSVSVPITPSTSAKTLMTLMQNALIKLNQGDLSNLKYAPHSADALWPDQASATADNMILVGRPVDTVTESLAGPAAVYPIMMSRVVSNESRAYMAKDAGIILGPQEMVARGTNQDRQISREYFNEYFRDLESLISMATGKTDRVAINRDLNSAKQYNALEALAYGERGLVDAILVGNDQVLSREKLNEFYQSKGWDPTTDRAQIDAFNNDVNNLDEIPSSFFTPLQAYNEHSVPAELQIKRSTRKNYTSIGDGIEDFAVVKRRLGDPRRIADAYIEPPSLRERITGAPDFISRLELLTGRPLFSFPGVIYDDTILFHTAFTDFSVNQVQRAIEALDEKKQRQPGEPSNIKILLNSPGGYVYSLEELRSTMQHQATPVDIIVQGMAASCGAHLLAIATGNRLAAPNARIMMHQVHTGPQRDYSEYYNQSLDNSQAIQKKAARDIAKATGRDFQDVWDDLRQGDIWLNTLEALFYGPKGMLDGILVGPNNAVTREDVEDYLKTDPEVQAFLKEKYGEDDPEKNVRQYLDDRLKKLREPNRIHDPQEWEKMYGRDPFEKPLQTLMAVAGKSKPLDQIEKLKGSAPRMQPNIDQFVVSIDDPNIEMMLPFLQAKQNKSQFTLGA